MTSFTQANLDLLEQAIASGVTEVSYDGQVTKYRSLNQMIQIRDMMRSELGLPASSTSASANTRRSEPYFSGYSKGYRS